jgi:hypothetical protein
MRDARLHATLPGRSGFAASRRRRTVNGGYAILVALVVLAGCKEEKHSAAPASAAASVADRVREATEQNLRAGAAPEARFRGVQVYQQAQTQRMAVCGQLSPFASDPALFVPFVSIVAMPLTPDERAPQYQFEHHIGTTTAEASRVYSAIVTYCYEQGGPAPGPYHSVLAPPPLPDSVPDLSAKGRAGTPAAAPAAKPATAPVSASRLPAPTPASPAAGTAPPPSSSDQSPASGSVTMRRNGNLHADPHGPSVRVVPQGTALRVFAQAPGGWYQVGDVVPWGWVHESMLDRH